MSLRVHRERFVSLQLSWHLVREKAPSALLRFILSVSWPANTYIINGQLSLPTLNLSDWIPRHCETAVTAFWTCRMQFITGYPMVVYTAKTCVSIKREVNSGTEVVLHLKLQRITLIHYNSLYSGTNFIDLLKYLMNKVNESMANGI
jgi:hypothetical protein